VALLAALLVACGRAPAPVQQTKKDITEEAWYPKTAADLSALDRQAEAAFKSGDQHKAAALIDQGKKMQEHLLEARQPTFAAMQGVADLDELYGDMLFTNRNYGWARMFYQKNLARWKHFPEQSDETARRVKLAEDGIAACDKKILQ
jgi:hypothetical protein